MAGTEATVERVEAGGDEDNVGSNQGQILAATGTHGCRVAMIYINHSPCPCLVVIKQNLTLKNRMYNIWEVMY